MESQSEIISIFQSSLSLHQTKEEIKTFDYGCKSNNPAFTSDSCTMIAVSSQVASSISYMSLILSWDAAHILDIIGITLELVAISPTLAYEK